MLPIETWTRFKLIHEPEWTGMSVSDICRKYGVSRKTFYKWRNRYSKYGMEGLKIYRGSHIALVAVMLLESLKKRYWI
ncbi:MAG: helix-turn-helix domain-containing protein [Nitrososphaerales archaeon]